MTTPATLLDTLIAQYTSVYGLNYAKGTEKAKELVLADAITWTIVKLFEKKLISKEEYNSLQSMAHSKDEENLVVAEAIIRNLNFEIKI